MALLAISICFQQGYWTGVLVSAAILQAYNWYHGRGR